MVTRLKPQRKSKTTNSAELALLEPRHGALPPPTDALPGSAEKVRILEGRRRLRQQLFHPKDKILPSNVGFEGGYSGGDNVFIDRIVEVLASGAVVELEKKPQRHRRQRTEQEKLRAQIDKELERLRKRQERASKRPATKGVCT